MIDFLKNLFLSLFLSMVLLFLLAVLMSKTSINENLSVPCIIGIVSFSLLISSFNYSRVKKEKGIIYGLILGGAYIFSLYIISSIVTLDFSLNLYSLIFISLGMLGGMLGGIVGVNLKN